MCTSDVSVDILMFMEVKFEKRFFADMMKSQLVFLLSFLRPCRFVLNPFLISLFIFSPLPFLCLGLLVCRWMSPKWFWKALIVAQQMTRVPVNERLSTALIWQAEITEKCYLILVSCTLVPSKGQNVCVTICRAFEESIKMFTPYNSQEWKFKSVSLIRPL